MKRDGSLFRIRSDVSVLEGPWGICLVRIRNGIVAIAAREEHYCLVIALIT